MIQMPEKDSSIMNKLKETISQGNIKELKVDLADIRSSPDLNTLFLKDNSLLTGAYLAEKKNVSMLKKLVLNGANPYDPTDAGGTLLELTSNNKKLNKKLVKWHQKFQKREGKVEKVSEAFGALGFVNNDLEQESVSDGDTCSSHEKYRPRK